MIYEKINCNNLNLHENESVNLNLSQNISRSKSQSLNASQNNSNKLKSPPKINQNSNVLNNLEYLDKDIRIKIIEKENLQLMNQIKRNDRLEEMINEMR